MIAEYKTQLEAFAVTSFQKDLLEASLNNLADESNKLRFNNFACGIRELSRHVLLSMASDEEVLACIWYKNETDKDGGITRAQRIRYAIHGGINIKYVENELIDIDDFISSVLRAISLLNKFTHINELTFGIEPDEVADLSSQVVSAFSNFIGVIEDCRQNLTSELELHIDNAVVIHSISQSLDAIDMLATHHSVEYTEITSINITGIKSSSMTIDVEGDVHVVLQYGSNSDLKNDIGVELNDSFPFSCELLVQIDASFPNGKIEVKDFMVDTDSWYEGEE